MHANYMCVCVCVCVCVYIEFSIIFVLITVRMYVFQRTFETFDKDGSGTLDIRELRRALQSTGTIHTLYLPSKWNVKLTLSKPNLSSQTLQ